MTRPSLSRTQLLVMAATTGTTIANIYYAQPVLALIGASFGKSAAAVGNIPTLNQAGFALGILFLAPMGDMLDRKKIVIALEALMIVALLMMATSHSLTIAAMASFAVGVSAVAVQIVVPMAVALSAPGQKGRVVGIVFTGTLIGILGSRILSGLAAHWIGWRAVYAGSAAIAVAITLLFAATLPSQRGNHQNGYFSLMRSTFVQIGRFPELRRLSLLGALIFGAFCCFWTTLTFQLNGPPFDYGSDRVGLFGFAAISGALAAHWFGRRADGAGPERLQMVTTGILLVGIAIASLFPASAFALVAATFVIDVGVQGTQVNNLAQLYGLDPAAHSRINTVFMTCFFLGGTAGTASGVIAWKAGGWQLVCITLLAWSIAALITSLIHASQAGRYIRASANPPS